MSIRGELVMGLMRAHDLSEEKARAIVKTFIDKVKDPNWAYRYHREIRPDDPEAVAMTDYWEMLDFIKEFA